MKSLSEALLLNRAELIRKESVALKAEISKLQSCDFKPQFAPFRYLIDTLAKRVDPMAAPVALDAQIAQIEWLANHGHYPAAASLAREWLVSLRVASSGGEVFPVSSEQREVAEKWFNTQARTKNNANDMETSRSDSLMLVAQDHFEDLTGDIAKWQHVIDFWRNLGDMRNDLMHFGMREHPRKPNTIQDFIKGMAAKLRDLRTGISTEGVQ